MCNVLCIAVTTHLILLVSSLGRNHSIPTRIPVVGSQSISGLVRTTGGRKGNRHQPNMANVMVQWALHKQLRYIII